MKPQNKHIREDYPSYYPVRREIKDRLFKFIFGDPGHKEWALSLYNSIEHTDYSDPEDLEIVTLENALYMHMKNDVGILVRSWNMAFWEHQSTLSPNIPFRFITYYAATMEKYVTRHRLNVYGSKTLKLPLPKFYVFYNGRKKTEEITTMKLSDLFYNISDEEPMLDLKVIQYNINGYGNTAGSCRQLYEYQWFIARIRSRLEETDPGRAVDLALHEMPKDFTIRDWLWENRSEVRDMSIFEFDDEYYKELFREEGLEEGREEGREEGGILADIRLIKRKMEQSGISFDEACTYLGLYEDEINACRRYLSQNENRIPQ